MYTYMSNGIVEPLESKLQEWSMNGSKNNWLLSKKKKKKKLNFVPFDLELCRNFLRIPVKS